MIKPGFEMDNAVAKAIGGEYFFSTNRIEFPEEPGPYDIFPRFPSPSNDDIHAFRLLNWLGKTRDWEYNISFSPNTRFRVWIDARPHRFRPVAIVGENLAEVICKAIIGAAKRQNNKWEEWMDEGEVDWVG